MVVRTLLLSSAYTPGAIWVLDVVAPEPPGFICQSVVPTLSKALRLLLPVSRKVVLSENLMKLVPARSVAKSTHWPVPFHCLMLKVPLGLATVLYQSMLSLTTEVPLIAAPEKSTCRAMFEKL